MTLVRSPRLACIQQIGQGSCTVYLQLGWQPYGISLTQRRPPSSEGYAGLRDSGVHFIVYVDTSGTSAAHVGEFIHAC